MKILLTTLNSKYVHGCLALRYLYSVVQGAPLDIDMREFTINNERGYIFGEIVRLGYDYVCFSCYIWNIEMIKDLISEIKKARPTTKIILGGPEVSYDTVSFMEENPDVDFIIRGEGEYPFFQLVKNITLGEAEHFHVGNLVYRDGDEIIANDESLLPTFDKIPFPYENLEFEEDKVLYYESSRGCPFKCAYCLSCLDKEIRPLPLDRVRRDLGYFLFKAPKQVKFVDRTFNYDMGRAYAIWEYLIDNDNGKTNFHFELCAELMNDKTLELLSKARKGLFQFEIGIQSANPMSLKAVNRKESIFPILLNTEKLLALGNIHIHVDLIAGLPYEDYQSFGRSFNKVYALGADNLQLGFLKLLRGTPIRENGLEHGYVYRHKAPYEIISNNYMSSTDILKLKMVETVLNLYHNKGGFEKTLPYLIKEVSRTPFGFYQKLADFYYSHGYQHRSHKKEDLYRILMAFAKSCAENENLEEGTLTLLNEDLENNMNFDAVKKFKKKGWEIE